MSIYALVVEDDDGDDDDEDGGGDEREKIAMVYSGKGEGITRYRME